MSDTENIHPLRLPAPRRRAGKSANLAVAISQVVIAGCKVNIFDPRQSRNKPIELLAASEEGELGCPFCDPNGRITICRARRWIAKKQQGRCWPRAVRAVVILNGAHEQQAAAPVSTFQLREGMQLALSTCNLGNLIIRHPHFDSHSRADAECISKVLIWHQVRQVQGWRANRSCVARY